MSEAILVFAPFCLLVPFIDVIIRLRRNSLGFFGVLLVIELISAAVYAIFIFGFGFTSTFIDYLLYPILFISIIYYIKCAYLHRANGFEVGIGDFLVLILSICLVGFLLQAILSPFSDL